MLDAARLARLMPCPVGRAERWAGPLAEAMREVGIDTPVRAAAFLAQVGHDSGSLAYLEENLSYGPEALRRTWPARFPTDELARQFARQPERIAERVYGGRLGNGPEGSGDGWRYRGRGLIQLTGRSHYREFGQRLGLPLEARPELLTEPGPAARSAAAYWEARGLNALADAGQFEAITRRINGGLHGQPDRLARWHRARKILGASP